MQDVLPILSALGQMIWDGLAILSACFLLLFIASEVAPQRFETVMERCARLPDWAKLLLILLFIFLPGAIVHYL